MKCVICNKETNEVGFTEHYGDRAPLCETHMPNDTIFTSGNVMLITIISIYLFLGLLHTLGVFQ